MPALPRFDFALSFAGADRAVARTIDAALVRSGYSVFIDERFEHEMLGVDGMAYLTDIYARQSRFCIVLLSEAYDRGVWTQLEREAIRSRELMGERGALIPIKLDSHCPSWLPPSRVYFDLSQRPLAQFLQILRAKHLAATGGPTAGPPPAAHPPLAIDGEWNSQERVGSGLARIGVMRLQQSGASVDGHASLVEHHPDGRTVQYQLGLHGEAIAAHGLVRFVGAMLGPEDPAFPRPYSVDSFALKQVDPSRLVGTCVDERGLQGAVTLVRKGR